MKVDLPKAQSATALDAPKFVVLALDKAGQAFVDDRPMGNDELAAVLLKAAQLNPDTEVRLRADATVPYGRVVEVMGLAHQSGLSRIGFVAEAPPAAK